MIAYNSYKNNGQWQKRSEEGARRVGMAAYMYVYVCVCVCVCV